jgi:RHS repeat-associated protein
MILLAESPSSWMKRRILSSHLPITSRSDMVSPIKIFSFLAALMIAANAMAQCSQPAGHGASGCAASYSVSASSVSANVTSHRWYTTQTGSTQITPTMQFSPTGGVWVSQLQTYFSASVSYWVAAVCNGTESPRTQVSFTLTSGSSISISPSGNPLSACRDAGFTLTASGGSSYSWYLGDPNNGGQFLSSATVYSPTSSGTHYLRGTTSCNSIQTTSIPVTMYDSPGPPTASNIRARYNSTAVLTASGATGSETYQFFNGNLQLIGSGLAYTTPNTHTTNTLYYVAKYLNCPGPKVSFNVLVNKIPVPDGGSNLTLAVPTSTCTLYGSATDGDGDAIAYQWTQVYGTTVSLTNQASPTLSVSGLASGIYVFRLTVTDSMGDSAYDDVTVEVKSVANNYNYTKTNIINVSGITTTAQIDALAVGNKNTTIDYQDGSGKSIESVQWKASPAGNDLMFPLVYDQLGRSAVEYLPVAYPQATGNYQTLLDASGEYTGSVATFYSDKPYAKTVFEATLRSRPIEQGSVGAAWQAGGATGTVTTTYGSNAANDIVEWAISTATEPNGLPASSAKVTVNLLATVTTTDNISATRQRIVQVVSNSLGQKIVEREKVDATNWAETYYVYNELNQLRFIVAPELMKILRASGNFNPTKDQVDRWCFQYQYDYRGRPVASKKPGAGWQYVVYDKRNRIVLSQDANQTSTNSWRFTKYDAMNRPVINGIYHPATGYTRAQLQTTVDALDGNKGYTNVTVAYTTTTTTGYPSADIDNYVVTHYDSYTGINAIFVDPAFQFTTEIWTATTGDPFLKSTIVKGATTAVCVRIIGSAQWLYTVNYYDTKQRLIQSLASLHTGGVIRSSRLYDFSSKVLETKQSQPSLAIHRRFQHDHAGRLLKTFHKVNSQPEVILSAFEYNEKGQVIDKKLYSTNLTTPSYLQSVDYGYNIRGWVTRNNLANGSDVGETDYFGYELGYETDVFSAAISSTLRKDGLPTATTWRNDFSAKQNLYAYDYDNLSRLTAANFKAGATAAWTSETDFFSEKSISYDYNGNIQTLSRNKQTGAATFQNIDNLSYNYGTSSGNQLINVTESSTAELKDQGFKDGNTAPNDFVYDQNGNFIQDKNKGIATVLYNFLNLPESIVFTTGAYIRNQYDAAGVKLSQTHFNSSGQTVTKTDYAGAYVLVNDLPALIFHEEGRLLPPAFTNHIVNREANGTEGYSANQSVTLTSVTQNGQTYVKVVSSQATSTPGVLLGTYTVKPGERYSFKILGYRETSHNAHLYVRNATGADVVWTGALLPLGLANETWATSDFVVPAGVTQIAIGVLIANPAVNATFYINRAALYKIDWEYQFFLEDMNGSPRVVLSSEPTTQTYLGTFESEAQSTESQQYLNIKPEHIAIHTANATPGGNEALWMNKDYRVGPAKSLKVYPGDLVDASVSAYYPAATSLTKATSAVIGNALIQVMTTGGVTGFDGGINTAYYNSAGGVAGFALSPNNGATRPSAFLNYILFNENYVPLEAKSVPVGTSANVKHLLSISATFGAPVNIREVGYLFVYLSYDNENTAPVYFDELKIIHQESPMVQVNDYYPFGLSAYTWTREGEYENRFLFQGKEWTQELGLQDFHARQYDGVLGRFLNSDPANQFASGYTGMGNNPIIMIDPNGEIAFIAVVGIFAAVNLAADAIRGDINSWGDALISLGIGAIQGALAATGPGGLAAYSGTGAGWLALGSAVASQINIPVYSSENFNLSISPSLSAGSTGARLGANVFASATIDNVTISGGYSVGRNFSSKDLSGKMAEAKWSSIYSGTIGVNTRSGTYQVGLTHFGGKYAQTLGDFGYSNGTFSIYHQNDWMVSGDKYRSAAIRASYRINDDVTVTGGFALFTGKGSRSAEDKYIINGKEREFYSNETPAFLRNGALYGGITYRGNSYRVGWNSDGIRHAIQNGWHNVIGSPHFLKQDYKGQLYTQFGNENPFTNY